MDKDRIYKEDILRAVGLIQDFVSGLRFDDFRIDEKTKSACMMQLAIIGEIVSKLSPEFRAQLLDIPWAEIVATRNVLIHQYAGVDLEDIWQAIQTDLPRLKRVLLETKT